MTPEDFYMALKELGFDLSQKQKDQFQRYFGKSNLRNCRFKGHKAFLHY